MGYTYSGSQFPQEDKPSLSEEQSLAIETLQLIESQFVDKAQGEFRLDVANRIIEKMRENIRMGSAPLNADDVIRGFEAIKNEAQKNLESIAKVEKVSPSNIALDALIKLLTRTN